MSLLFPPRLQVGDRVRVVLTSGPCNEAELRPGIEIWRSWGLEVDIDLPKHPAPLSYLAGNDGDRLHKLQSALDDPACKAILCGRGGYGVTRLLSELDWTDFRAQPKWIVGFSDITALLWAAARQGIASLHGPLVATLAAESLDVQRDMWSWLTSGTGYEWTGSAWQSGSVTGTLLPANLAVATALIGTSDWPLPLPRVILAWEDINEDAYRIDRLLTQWRHIGAFASVVGIALGRFSWSDPLPSEEIYDATATLRDRLLDLGLPVVADLPFGHGIGDNRALPVGAQATLDGDRGTLRVLSASQTDAPLT
ncbi:MAG: LD-carboxypeptidase [Cyanobacteria bacterium P01_F01_bin.33]